ncbi:MAG: tetratricopeptide repeat protein [Candidatus Omnitrophica bacterium]|nr:tetratricopeptide repeat protein [Candidatus Omnitrophota bacterium]MBU1996205.1 tetratricopeptide repeat protein [Candidatus Omnitrophota bacterium]
MDFKNKNFLIKLAILIFVGIVIYSNTLNSEFQLDDLEFIVNNENIRSFDEIAAYSRIIAPTRFVSFLSFALNYHFGRLNVLGYHVFNMGVHLISALFVWWLVVLIFSTPRLKTMKDHDDGQYVGFFAALLFVSHPVQTQAVTYITQRFASMAAMFYLASVCFYLKSRLSLSKNKLDVRYAIAAIVSALFGLFTKEIVITLPLVILLIEKLLLNTKGEQIKSSGISKFKFLLFCVIFIGFISPYLFSFNVSNIFLSQKISGSHDGDIITLGKYVLTQLKVWMVYLRLLLLPINQNIDYDFALSSNVFEPAVMFSYFILMTIILFAYKVRFVYPLVAFSIFWFFITLSCELIPRRHVIFEHKLYLPSVGFFILLALCLSRWVRDKEKLKALIAVIVVVFSLMTVVRNDVWRSEVSLWEDAHRKSPNKYRTNLNLGKAYLEVNKLDKALLYIDKAIEIVPSSYAYTNRGILFSKRQMFDEALKEFQTALKIDETFPQAHITYFHRGNIFMATGNDEQALSDYKKVIKLKPKYLRVYNNRGTLYLNQKKYDLALNDFNKVIEINPDFSFGYLNRALVYRAQNNYEKAIDDLNEAVRLNPKNEKAYYWRGVILGKIGAFKPAIKEFDKALRLAPAFEKARVMREIAVKSYEAKNDDQ